MASKESLDVLWALKTATDDSDDALIQSEILAVLVDGRTANEHQIRLLIVARRARLFPRLLEALEELDALAFDILVPHLAASDPSDRHTLNACESLSKAVTALLTEARGEVKP